MVQTANVAIQGTAAVGDMAEIQILESLSEACRLLKLLKVSLFSSLLVNYLPIVCNSLDNQWEKLQLAIRSFTQPLS